VVRVRSYGLEPDLLLCAKGITSGYVPLGAVVAAPRVAEPFWGSAPGDGAVWRHGYTYYGHAVAAAAGLANLDLMESERLPERALRLESLLASALEPLAALPAVAEVRAGAGVLAAVQLADPGAVGAAVAGLRAAGVLTRGPPGGALQVSPPLVVSEGQLDDLAAAVRAVLG
jgi:putrescine aminotransferase